jgi:two-component system, OmpR family, sensor histidine kinase BaeS
MGRRRGRFVWRIGCLLVGLILFVSVVATVGVWLAASALGLVGGGPGVRFAAVSLLVLAGVGIAFGMRRLRGLATPMGDLVDAAHRIEAGDYSVRVAERGPPEMRSLVRALNAMSARLEATDARRRSFLAEVTHELRTPLAIIRGQAEGITDGVYAAGPAQIAPILDATHALEVLVEDLRTLSLSETGSLTLTREPVDLAVLVNETLASFHSAAETAGVTLTEDVAADVPPVEVDPARIRGVLGNLLTNAIRYTPHGGSVTVLGRSSGGHVTVTVVDTGEGIPEELLPRVFDRFVKGPRSTGSGLGLAIARDVVVAHGGSIDVQSRTGAGTTVQFTLPIGR